MKEFSLVEQLNEKQIQQLLTLFKKMWWAASENRTIQDVITLLKNCMSFGVVENETENLIGYARVLTDEVKYAFIFDVMVDEQYRGKGLGNVIMEAIIDHPKLKNIKNFALTCAPDMLGFYEKFGFSEDYGKVRAMRYSRDIKQYQYSISK